MPALQYVMFYEPGHTRGRSQTGTSSSIAWREHGLIRCNPATTRNGVCLLSHAKGTGGTPAWSNLSPAKSAGQAIAGQVILDTSAGFVQLVEPGGTGFSATSIPIGNTTIMAEVWLLFLRNASLKM